MPEQIVCVQLADEHVVVEEGREELGPAADFVTQMIAADPFIDGAKVGPTLEEGRGNILLAPSPHAPLVAEISRFVRSIGAYLPMRVVLVEEPNAQAVEVQPLEAEAHGVAADVVDGLAQGKLEGYLMEGFQVVLVCAAQRQDACGRDDGKGRFSVPVAVDQIDTWIGLEGFAASKADDGKRMASFGNRSPKVIVLKNIFHPSTISLNEQTRKGLQGDFTHFMRNSLKSCIRFMLRVELYAM
jgi:hypothetical protein